MTQFQPFSEQGPRHWCINQQVLHDLTPEQVEDLTDFEWEFVHLFRKQDPDRQQQATVKRDSGERVDDASVFQKFIDHFKANLTPEPTV